MANMLNLIILGNDVSRRGMKMSTKVSLTPHLLFFSRNAF